MKALPSQEQSVFPTTKHTHTHTLHGSPGRHSSHPFTPLLRVGLEEERFPSGIQLESSSLTSKQQDCMHARRPAAA